MMDKGGLNYSPYEIATWCRVYGRSEPLRNSVEEGPSSRRVGWCREDVRSRDGQRESVKEEVRRQWRLKRYRKGGHRRLVAEKAQRRARSQMFLRAPRKLRIQGVVDNGCRRCCWQRRGRKETKGRMHAQRRPGGRRSYGGRLSEQACVKSATGTRSGDRPNSRPHRIAALGTHTQRLPTQTCPAPPHCASSSRRPLLDPSTGSGWNLLLHVTLFRQSGTLPVRDRTTTQPRIWSTDIGALQG